MYILEVLRKVHSVDRQPMLFYDAIYNSLRILYPDGKVELLHLDTNESGDWRYSIFTDISFDAALELLTASHELIGLV